MNARAYYNEWDKYAAQWLQNLIAAGLIAPGDVDERSIVDVRADDLRGYTQCHFFAGIGGWSYSLRLARWPDNRPVWTASCPCQPYSAANCYDGGAQGQGDKRDLWPDFWRLGKQLKPTVIFGEQVANAISWGWWDRAALEMEQEAYACAATVLRANAYKARHERRRLHWVAKSRGARWKGYQSIKRIFERARTPQSVNGNSLARAWAALDGNYSDLLSSDGVSVAVERCATKGYGNAVVPEGPTSEFVRAYLETESLAA